MPQQSPLRLIKKAIEYVPHSDIERIPRGLRGIYVLYKKRGGDLDVVYVGMTNYGSGGGIRGRLKQHRDRKGELFSHFSAFEVWDNISNEEIAELEGLFRHIYRSDPRANRLNVQRGFKKLSQLERIPCE